MENFTIPKIVLEKYDQLYDLCQNQSTDGRLKPDQVAKYCGVNVEWLLRTTYNGLCPFAFGSNKGVGRGSSLFHVLPFYNFMTQGAAFRWIPDKESDASFD